MDLMILGFTRFSHQDFDDWAETYDAAVRDDCFPFNGYTQVLERIIKLAEPKEGMKVLDLGTGTGNLAFLFAQKCCFLCCTDFSSHMLDKARKKLPEAQFFLHDIQTPLPREIIGPFDRIVSTYVFHHFILDEKIRILQSFKGLLTKNGKIIIGDVAFPNHASLEVSRADMGENWEEEFYWVAEEALPALNQAGFQVHYEQISACAGIFSLITNKAEL